MARPFVKRKIAAVAALALCALAHGQTSSSNSTQTPTTDENSLESARRELKDLPAMERSRDVLGKQSGLGSAGLPALTLPGDTGNSSARPDPNKPLSPTWLQDALNRTDAEAAAHRRGNDPTLARERDRPGGYKAIEAPNPLGQYMEQWISPRDLELLRAGQDAKKSNEPTQSFVKPWEPPQTANTAAGFMPDSARAPMSDVPDTPIVPIMSAPRNPYIDEPVSAAPLPGPNSIIPQVASGQPQADRTHGPDPLPSMSAATPQGSRQPAPLKPAAAATAEPQRPPTAPIVDDRKYFPQLRRF